MAPSTGDARRAVRLTFAYEPSGMRLIDRTALGKPAGPGDDPGAPWPDQAIGAELRTADQRATFRRLLPAGAIPADVEVFDPAIPGGVRRQPAPPPSGVFTVVVPDDGDATEVVLMAGPAAATTRIPPGGPATAGLASGPAVLGRFPFRER